jgi:hypothetical protein
LMWMGRGSLSLMVVYIISIIGRYSHSVTKIQRNVRILLKETTHPVRFWQQSESGRSALPFYRNSKIPDPCSYNTLLHKISCPLLGVTFDPIKSFYLRVKWEVDSFFLGLRDVEE